MYNWSLVVSFQNVPVASAEVGALAAFLMLISVNCDPLYTLRLDADASNHNSPLRGAVGAVVLAEFSKSFTKFSLNASP